MFNYLPVVGPLLNIGFHAFSKEEELSASREACRFRALVNTITHLFLAVVCLIPKIAASIPHFTPWVFGALALVSLVHYLTCKMDIFNPNASKESYARAIRMRNTDDTRKYADKVPFSLRLEIAKASSSGEQPYALKFVLGEKPTEQEVVAADDFLSSCIADKPLCLERAKSLFGNKPDAVLAWFRAKELQEKSVGKRWDNTKLATKYLHKRTVKYYHLDLIQFLLEELKEKYLPSKYRPPNLPSDIKTYLENCQENAVKDAYDLKLVAILADFFPISEYTARRMTKAVEKDVKRQARRLLHNS